MDRLPVTATVWRERAARALLVVVGLIHLVPGYVALAPSQLSSAYGVVVTGDDLEVLLRHRAVLLGLVGCGLIVAAFHAALRPAMSVAALVSMGAFLLLAVTSSGLSPQTMRVAWIDVAAFAGLVTSIILTPRRAAPVTALTGRQT